jgi:hypothetical protein
VTGYEDDPNCTATETVPDGYVPDESDCLDVPLLAVGSCEIINIAADATFTVQKLFMDGNTTQGLTLRIECNTGLPLSQEFVVEPPTDGDELGDFEVKFIVTNFENEVMSCEVWEDVIPGYTGTYEVNGGTCNDNGEADPDCDEGLVSLIDGYGSGPCTYMNVDGGDDNLCVIRNYPDPVEITVNKVWEFLSEIDGIDDQAVIDLRCINVWDGDGEECFDQPGMCWTWYIDGDESNTAWIYPNWDGGTSCMIDETIFDNAVESTGCEGTFDIFVGSGDRQCTITNTVFFEGIPTLNQFGLLLLALLMLGIGALGFRRFT